jgi:hypothetical protein
LKCIVIVKIAIYDFNGEVDNFFIDGGDEEMVVVFLGLLWERDLFYEGERFGNDGELDVMFFIVWDIHYIGWVN